MILLPVIGSRAPVGSSARMTFGLVINALPIATLWASPPDNVGGKDVCSDLQFLEIPTFPWLFS